MEGRDTLKIIWQKKVNAVLKTDPFADATMPANQNNETEIKTQTERAHRY